MRQHASGAQSDSQFHKRQSAIFTRPAHGTNLAAPFAQRRSFSHSTACTASKPSAPKFNLAVLKRRLDEFKPGDIAPRYEKLTDTQLVRQREMVFRDVAEATGVLFSEAKFSRAQACERIRDSLRTAEGVKDFLAGISGNTKDKLMMWAGQRIPKIDPDSAPKTNNTDREALDRNLHAFLVQPENLERLLAELPSRALWNLEAFNLLLPGDIRALQFSSTEDNGSSRDTQGPAEPTTVSETTDFSQRNTKWGAGQDKPLVRFHIHNTAKGLELSTDRPETMPRTLSAPSNGPASASAPALPHLTAASTVHMVSVSDKPITTRQAIAYAIVRYSKREPLNAILRNRVEKGDVLAVSRIAGIMGAKKTADIIPLCHPGLQITHVEIDVETVDGGSPPTKQVKEDQKSKLSRNLPDGMIADSQEAELWIAKRMFLTQGVGPFGGVKICAKVACSGKTGVEMEALTAATTAALSVIDMCKALDKGMELFGAKVVYKDGGRSGTYRDVEWGT